ncbi:TIR-like protein FxsC [Kitasatospora sp. NPDC004289]
MSSALDRAREVLRASGADLDLPELLDVLWLARALPPGHALPPGRALPLGRHPLPGGRAAGGPAAAGTEPLPEEEAGPDGARRTVRRLYAGTVPGSGHGGTRETGLPEPRALPDAHVLARALRSLNRRRTVPRGGELDESATATRWAETGLPELVLRPGREPWLRCVLVVDDGVPMLIWRKLVSELDALLGRLGGFRQTTVVGLRNRGPGPVRLRARPFGVDGPDRSPATVTDTTGRTLVLVVTDGAGAAWRDGRMRAVLDHWGRRGPTAVLHTLPSRMWPGSGVAGDPYPATSPAAGVPNSRWQLPPWAPGGIRGAAEEHVPVPVLELSPASLQAWAGLVAAGGTTWLRLWEEGPAPQGAARPGLRPPTAERELEHFLRAASPGARRLAAYIAHLAPLSVPAMRLVGLAAPAAAGRPEPGSVELAEVLLGGLLRPVPPPVDAGPADVPPQYRQFDFLPEAKEHLAGLVPVVELRTLRQEVSGRLEGLAGAAPDFPAWLSADGPGPAGRGELGLATGRLLRRLEPGESAAAVGDTVEAQVSRPAAEGRSSAVPPTEPPRTTARPRPETARGAYFFLSYAHTPQLRSGGDPNHWVTKLFEDLSESVMSLTDHPADRPVGFMDRSMHQGDRWRERISHELADCRVFVPLYSPRYFASRACGQEWYTFSQRLAHSLDDAQSASGIVPVLWVPTPDRQLPEVARQLPSEHRRFGQEYADEGMYALLKLSYFRHQYELAVHRLAQRIVEVAESTVVRGGEPLVDFTTQPSAFAAPRGLPMRISVVAYRTGDRPSDTDPRNYGARSLDWVPFPADSPHSVAEHAARIAQELGFAPSVHGVDEELEVIASGSRPTAPAVVLVDRQARLRGHRRDVFERLDRLALEAAPWLRVVMVDHQARFEEALRSAMTEASRGFGTSEQP